MCHQCNRCHQCQPYCQCDNRTTYDPCAKNQKCIQKMDAECVIYEMNNPSGLSELKCLGLPNGTNLKQFMIAVDRKFCSLQGDVYVKVNEQDSQTGYLSDKITVEPNSCLKMTIVDGPKGKQMQVGIDYNCLCNKIKNDCNLGGCSDIDGGDYLPTPPPVPVPVTPPVPVPVTCTGLTSCTFHS